MKLFEQDISRCLYTSVVLFLDMTLVDVEAYLNSEEMTKLFTIMQDSSAMNQFVMENLKVYMEDQAKVSYNSGTIEFTF